jgi:anti-sigma factor RsiW
MTPTRFQFLLDAYGADLRSWPAAERAAAEALLAGSPEAAEARRMAIRLQRALEQTVPEVSDDAVGRVLDALDRIPLPVQAAATAPPKPATYRWVPPAVLGLVAVLGFLVGMDDLATDAASSSQAGFVSGVLTTDPTAELGL